MSPSCITTDGPVLEMQESTRETGAWAASVTRWLLGDWKALASLHIAEIEGDSRRAELATLAACAQIQIGNACLARQNLSLASRWGCSPQFMVRALLASAEANFARYHGLMGHHDKEAQLLASSAGAFGGDGSLAARARKALASDAGSPTKPPFSRASLPKEPCPATAFYESPSDSRKEASQQHVRS